MLKQLLLMISKRKLQLIKKNKVLLILKNKVLHQTKVKNQWIKKKENEININNNINIFIK